MKCGWSWLRSASSLGAGAQGLGAGGTGRQVAALGGTVCGIAQPHQRAVDQQVVEHPPEHEARLDRRHPAALEDAVVEDEEGEPADGGSEDEGGEHDGMRGDETPPVALGRAQPARHAQQQHAEQHVGQGVGQRSAQRQGERDAAGGEGAEIEAEVGERGERVDPARRAVRAHGTSFRDRGYRASALSRIGGPPHVLIYLGMADTLFFSCVVEHFSEQGGFFPGFELNVGENGRPLNGSSWIADPRVAGKLQPLWILVQ